MTKLSLALCAILLLFPLNSFGQSFEIPDWVRDNAKLWSVTKISDQDFAKGLEYLIQQGIITIPQTVQTDSDSFDQIPSWLRKNAGWWSQGFLSDGEFVKSIEYLIDKGIIHVHKNKIVCLGNELCIRGQVEKIVDGDTIYVEGYEVRLSLTNTPERNEIGFSSATEFTKKLCPVGSIAAIDQDDKQPYDKYGRLLGKMYCGEKSLNSELLYQGFANILTQFCSKSEFASEPWAQQYGCSSKNTESKQQIPKETTVQTPNQDDCDPSYPDFCIKPNIPDLDCKDVLPHKNFTVHQPDPHHFDGNKDGKGCE